MIQFDYDPVLTLAICYLLFAICTKHNQAIVNTNILKIINFTAPKNIVCTQPFRCMLLPDTKGMKTKDIKELWMQAVGGWSLRKHSFLLFCCYSINVRSRQDGDDFDVWETLWKSPKSAINFSALESQLRTETFLSQSFSNHK